MKTARAVLRTPTFISVLGLLLIQTTGTVVRAETPLCPSCPDLLGSVTLDVATGKLIIEVEESPGFDAGSMDDVELLLVEDPYAVRVDVNFAPQDLENAIWEQHSLPSEIRGDGTTAYLRFFDTSSNDEVLVPLDLL